ncbi:MAG: amino acid kinase family protein, partial [Candidatus Helarchaeota archaeon]
MDAVIKIGGSVLQSDTLQELCRYLDQLIQDFSFIILPGGGAYANLVRKFDQKYHLSNTIAHWMAILSENILGFFLLDHLNSGTPAF